MRNISKYLFVAVMAAFTFASCEKEKENPILNPSGTPVQFTFSATATSETTADLKVVSDVPVPADVTINIAADASNTMAGMTFPSEMVMQKGNTEVTGKLTVDKDALTPEVRYNAVLVASVAGTPFGKVAPLSIKVPKPAPVTVDGNVDEWAKLPSDYVTELACAEDAELNGLKSAKVFYEDKLYVLLEVTDEALAQGVADGKLRLHFYFDNGNNGDGGYKEKIDCMLEGKMTSGGEWCALSSAYYQWTGTDPNVWGGSWTAADASPAFTFAGKGNYYECAMDYSKYPGGLADVIGMGFDIQNGDYVAMGYLPSSGTVAQVVKNGAEIPKEPELVIKIDGDFSDWKSVESIPGDGALKTLKMAQNETKMFFYLEVEKTDDVKLDEAMAFAHKVMLCFDNGDLKGDKGNEAWGGARYDKIVDIWLMQRGAPNMITWGLDGFEHKEADGDVQKYEFCFNKSVDPVFSSPCLVYGAFINTQVVDTSSGSEVWDGSDVARIGSAPVIDQPMPYVGEAPNPELVAITIDGDMAEWENVTSGLYQEDGVYISFKVTYDANNIYVYSKRTWHSGLWGGGYYYYQFDTDNNPETGLVGEGAINGGFTGYGIETWLYIQPFGGTADEPAFNTAPEGGSYPDESVLANVTANGVTDKTVIETEACIPRANLGVKKGDIIRVYSVGNKSASNLARTPVVLRLDK